MRRLQRFLPWHPPAWKAALNAQQSVPARFAGRARVSALSAVVLLGVTLIVCSLQVCPSLAAQSISRAVKPLAPGTILPVSLDTAVHWNHAYPGQRIRATVMQSIPGTAIHRGARLEGEVIAVTQAPQHRLVLRFTTLRLRHAQLPVAVSLRAMASLLEVEEAEVPEDMAMRGTVPENATTRQIGGQQVYRGGGPVAEGMVAVGQPVAYGILAVPMAHPGEPCRASVGDSSSPQAFWVFSSDACGLYGYDHLRLEHAGRSRPAGEIVFTASHPNATLQSGSGLLLRVRPPDSTAPALPSGSEMGTHQQAD